MRKKDLSNLEGLFYIDTQYFSVEISFVMLRSMKRKYYVRGELWEEVPV